MKRREWLKQVFSTSAVLAAVPAWFPTEELVGRESITGEELLEMCQDETSSSSEWSHEQWQEFYRQYPQWDPLSDSYIGPHS